MKPVLKRDFKFLLITIPLLLLILEISLRCFGMGYLIDDYQKNFIDSFQEAAVNASYQDSKLVGTWKVSDCDLGDMGKCNIILTFGASNYYSETIIPAQDNLKPSQATIRKKGAYYVQSGRFILVPMSYKNGKNFINRHKLQENVQDYSDIYTYSIDDNGLVMNNEKTGQNITLKKML